MSEGRQVALRVNGEELTLFAGSDLTESLRQLGFDPGAGGFAVAIDGEVVPRGEWSRTTLQGGEDIEIVRAVQGG